MQAGLHGGASRSAMSMTAKDTAYQRHYPLVPPPYTHLLSLSCPYMSQEPVVFSMSCAHRQTGTHQPGS